MKNIVYFDLETKRSFQDVGGRGNIDKLGMSIGVTFSTANQGYTIYGEPEVNDLITELQRADLVVGFNHIGFDYEVLHAYTPLDLRQIPSLDMLLEVQKTLNHRLPLDSIAHATLGVEKIADGLQALEWYKQGRMEEIAEYCCFDVKITKLVHEYGVAYKKLHYTNKFGNKLSLEVDW
ncbi:MAG: helicase [Verrucomicrobiales bacterium]|jgi:DEAD/DEAH box helicase domain-containing protein|nr:helicase [Verrucomicrobiales bacterium]|tara:strand:+ start:1035 stop:1568 length:534 start_codon:yes stop_codon:yes gene_type:complete